MNAMLIKTLKCIASETPNFDISFALVDKLCVHYGEAKLADRLYREIDDSIPWNTVADLFGILVWSLSDNGHELMKTMEKWLTDGTDLRKMRVALNLDVYPFLDQLEMETTFAKIAEKHPTIETELQILIKKRRGITNH